MPLMKEMTSESSELSCGFSNKWSLFSSLLTVRVIHSWSSGTSSTLVARRSFCLCSMCSANRLSGSLIHWGRLELIVAIRGLNG